MADIDAILAGGGKTNADFDLGKINRSYWEGQDQRAKNDLRDAFKGGVPLTADGQPDFASMAKTLFQKGGLSEGTSAANLGLQQQNMQFGQGQSRSISSFEGGQPQTPSQPIVGPSTSRNTVSIDPSKRADASTSQSPQPAQQPTVMTVLAAQGIPNDQLGAASASIARQLGVDPAAPLNVQDPQVRNVLGPAIAQLKRQGIGQVQPPQLGDNSSQGQPSPVTNAVTTTSAPQAPSRIDQAITFYSGIMSDPRSPKQNVELAKTRLEALQKSNELTPLQKEYAQAVTQGFSGTMQDFAADTEARKVRAMEEEKLTNTQMEYRQARQQGYRGTLQEFVANQKANEPTPTQKEYAQAKREGFVGTMQDFAADAESRKTAATEEAKLGAKKYESLIENGTKAQMEIPQLELLQEQMNDPNFFSGVGEKYTLLYKRLKSAVGIDPEAAVPQEYLRKATAANVLSSLGALKGLGQIRVAEINMAREAAASPDNSIPANKLLVEISKRTHERNADIAEKAQAYKEKNGTLDAGFDKQVTAYYKQNPLFTDAEIKDWHKIIGQAKPQQSASAASQKFSSPADVHAAVAAGRLKKGDAFQDSNGTTRYVP